MAGYTKLFSSIVLSTVWREPNHVRIVWITMLALAEADGYVGASVPGLADAARVTLAECQEALASFLAPDEWSRSKEHDGRRIEVVDRGWRILNYQRFRNERDQENRREQWRLAQRKARQRGVLTSDDTVDSQPYQPRSAHAEAEAEAEDLEKAPRSTHEKPKKPKTPKTPKRETWRKVPESWQPEEAHRKLADKLHLDFAFQLGLFRDHEYKDPKSDANAAFRTWLQRAPGFLNPRNGAPMVQTGGSIRQGDSSWLENTK